MHKIILILFFIAPFCSHSADWRNFTLEPDPWFSIRTTGKGQISVDNGSVTIKLETAQIVGTEIIKDKYTVVHLQAGIAHYVNKEEWLVSSLSSPKPINSTITNGQKLTITPFETTFNVSTSILEKEHWIVLQIALRNEEGKLVYGFTHEP